MFFAAKASSREKKRGCVSDECLEEAHIEGDAGV